MVSWSFPCSCLTWITTSFFLLLNNMQRMDVSHFVYSFHQLMDIWVVSTLRYYEYSHDTTNICVQVFVETGFHISWLYTQEHKCYMDILLTFWGTDKLFSSVVVTHTGIGGDSDYTFTLWEFWPLEVSTVKQKVVNAWIMLT